MIRVVKKPDVRKAEIVRGARHLFLKQEYEMTSMQHVVEYLGIAKGTIYHYFKSKDELLEAVVEDLVGEEYQRKKALLVTLKGNALKKIRELAASNPPEDLLKKLHQPGNRGLHALLVARAVTIEASLYESLIRQGCEEGLFQTGAPLECAEFMLAAVQFLTDVGIYPWENKDLERRLQAFPALIEALLKAPKGSFQFLAI